MQSIIFSVFNACLQLSRMLLKHIVWLSITFGLCIGAFWLWYNTPHFSKTVLTYLYTQPIVINQTASNIQKDGLPNDINRTDEPEWLEHVHQALTDKHSSELPASVEQKVPSTTNEDNHSQPASNQSSDITRQQSSNQINETVIPPQTTTPIETLITPYDPSVVMVEPPKDVFWQDIAKQKSKFTKLDKNSPKVIVVLGGGLTRNKDNQIIVNNYTIHRLITAQTLASQTGIPLLLSGVEAPYMREWLVAHGGGAIFRESNSLNTCENARFSSLLLLKYGGANKVYLVSDAYHIPRAKRLFALNGIETIDIPAPLPTLKDTTENNRLASRRALYELIALKRDQWFGVSNCREVP